MCRYYTFGKLRFYLSFETHTVVNQIPAAPERTLSRSEGRMVLSSTAHRSPLRTWIENLQAVGGGINRGPLLVHVCEKDGLKSIIMQKMGKNGGEGGDTAGATRLQFGRGARGQRSEIYPYGRPWIRRDQNTVFFRITTNPGIFVCSCKCTG